jgi:hypothetical protein
MQWFRMYAEFLTDPLIRMLSFEDQRHFVAALCLKSSGALDKDYPTPVIRRRVIASLIGLSDVTAADSDSHKSTFDEANRRLREMGLIDEDWHPINWDKRQFVSDHDAAERKRKQRLRQRHNDVTTNGCDSHSHVTPSESDTEQIQSQNRTENTTAASQPTVPPEFADFKSLYPKRAGSQPWDKALKAVRARLRTGSTWSEILEGARRYAEFIRATDKERTEYVLQAATFCGPDKRFLEPWTLPATKADARLSSNVDVMREFIAGENP